MRQFLVEQALENGGNDLVAMILSATDSQIQQFIQTHVFTPKVARRDTDRKDPPRKVTPKPAPTLNLRQLSDAPIPLQLISSEGGVQKNSSPWIFFVIALIFAIGGALVGYYWAEAIGTFSDVRPIALAAAAGTISIISTIYGCHSSCKPTSLLAFWDKVAEKNDKDKEIRARLEAWLRDEVTDPSKYNHIQADLAPQAAKELQAYLSFLLNEMDKSKYSDEQRRNILLRLYEASNVCSPTWLEVAKNECINLQGGNTGKQVMLRFVQAAKESLILEVAGKQYPNAQWHALNLVRKLAGKELGLDTSTVDFDSAAYDDGTFTKEMILKIFHDHCTAEALINRVHGLMIAAHLDPKDNGLDSRLSDLLSSRARKDAAAKGEDPDSDAFDEALYVVENFYTKKNKKYIIKKEAVELLLIEIGQLT